MKYVMKPMTLTEKKAQPNFLSAENSREEKISRGQKGLANENEIGESAKDIEHGACVKGEVLVRSQVNSVFTDSKPGEIAQIRARHVDVPFDALPVKISHSVVHDAREDEWEKVAQEKARFLVVGIEEPQKPDQDMIRLEPSERRDHRDIGEPQGDRPKSSSHLPAGQEPFGDSCKSGRREFRDLDGRARIHKSPFRLDGLNRERVPEKCV